MAIKFQHEFWRDIQSITGSLEREDICGLIDYYLSFSNRVIPLVINMAHLTA
jgi:hypothetical protein